MAVSVLPERRRRGLGRRLAAEAIARAFAASAGRAVFRFNPENAAVAAMARAIRPLREPPGAAVRRAGVARRT